MASWDGQSLWTQPLHVQRGFMDYWGSRAEEQWVTEHNQALRSEGWTGPNQPPRVDVGAGGEQPRQPKPFPPSPPVSVPDLPGAATVASAVPTTSGPSAQQSGTRYFDPYGGSPSGVVSVVTGSQPIQGQFGGISPAGSNPPQGFNYGGEEFDYKANGVIEYFPGPGGQMWRRMKAATAPAAPVGGIAWSGGSGGAMPGATVQEQAQRGQQRIEATPGAAANLAAGQAQAAQPQFRGPMGEAVVPGSAATPAGIDVTTFGPNFPAYPKGDGTFLTPGQPKDAAWTRQRMLEGAALGLDTSTWWTAGAQEIQDAVNQAKQARGTSAVMKPGASVEALAGLPGGGAADGGAVTGDTAGDSEFSRLVNLWQAYLDLETRKTLEGITQGQFGRELAGTQFLSSLAQNPLNFGAYLGLSRSGEGANFLQSLAQGKTVNYLPSGGPTSVNAAFQVAPGDGGGLYVEPTLTSGGRYGDPNPTGSFGLDMGRFVERFQRPGSLDWQQYAKGTTAEKSAFASLLPAFLGIPMADFFERERRASLPETTGFGRTARQVSL